MTYRFKPYQGKTYALEGHRLLILGESHYGKDYVGDDEQPKQVMQSWREGGAIKTLSYTARLLSGHTTAEIRQQRMDYFNGCLFYNYFQVYVGEKPRQFFIGQSKADIQLRFSEATVYLSKLLNDYQPTHVLGWGWRLGEGILGMQSDFISTKRDAFGDGYHQISTNNTNCAIMFIQHPSAPGDLYKKQAQRVMPFLNEHGGIKPTAIYNATKA